MRGVVVRTTLMWGRERGVIARQGIETGMGTGGRVRVDTVGMSAAGIEGLVGAAGEKMVYPEVNLGGC